MKTNPLVFFVLFSLVHKTIASSAAAPTSSSSQQRKDASFNLRSLVGSIGPSDKDWVLRLVALYDTENPEDLPAKKKLLNGLGTILGIRGDFTAVKDEAKKSATGGSGAALPDDLAKAKLPDAITMLMTDPKYPGGKLLQANPDAVSSLKSGLDKSFPK